MTTQVKRLFCFLIATAALYSSAEAPGNGARTFYDVLGVSRDASDSDIRRAFRQAALRAHPDKRRVADNREFEQLNEAYSTLSEPSSRSEYDAQLASRHSMSPSSVRLAVDLFCSLEEMLGGWQEVVVLHRRGILRVPTWVPPGSKHCDTLRVRLNALQLDVHVRLHQKPHLTYTRIGDDLRTVIWCHPLHNWVRPPLRLRTVCGHLLTVSSAGMRIQKRETRTFPGYGMPRSADQHESLARRGALIVEVRVRSMHVFIMDTALLAGVALLGWLPFKWHAHHVRKPQAQKSRLQLALQSLIAFLFDEL
uniref:J domain-containing protein n=1 Tax=Calcidiscus leptoporus TaxID=127549 RepID=A0A7S0J0M8_9EUKA|mmetsp:Transcript_32500/g.75799  ORF Transcript_32500/g.75799 Transcript_32500/m.75799 type:complete len:308 (+) Transcript_32500:65-988(+)